MRHAPFNQHYASSVARPRIVGKVSSTEDAVLIDIFKAYGGPIDCWMKKKFSKIDSHTREEIVAWGLYCVWKNRLRIDPLLGVRNYYFRTVQNLMCTHAQSLKRKHKIRWTVPIDSVPEPEALDDDHLTDASNSFLEALSTTLDVSDVELRILQESLANPTNYASSLATELGMTSSNIRQKKRRLMDMIAQLGENNNEPK